MESDNYNEQTRIGRQIRKEVVGSSRGTTMFLSRNLHKGTEENRRNAKTQQQESVKQDDYDDDDDYDGKSRGI
jgi:hypothetical protein